MPFLLAPEKRRLKAFKKKKKKTGKTKKKKKGSSDDLNSDLGERSASNLSSSASGLKTSTETKIDESDLSVGDKERMIDLLHSLKLTKYIDLFVEEDIGMRALMLLTDDDLKSLGVKMGGRRVILDYTQKEREREEKEKEEQRRIRSSSGNGQLTTKSRSGNLESKSTSTRTTPITSRRQEQIKHFDANGSSGTTQHITSDDDTCGEDCNFDDQSAPEEREEEEAELR